MDELNKLLAQSIIKFELNQICINTVPGQEDNYSFGVGSLYYDWSNSLRDKTRDIVISKRTDDVKEVDFTVLCSQFKNTLFEDVFNQVTSRYKIGRMRIMELTPKSCLTWHVDDTIRIHYPMKTQPGCIMVIEDEVKFLEQNKWWHTNTLLHHSAFNGSMESRYHLVTAVLEEYGNSN